MGAKNTKKFERRPPSAYPIFGQGCWRPKPCVYTALINTLLQRGVIGRPAVLNRFSGFHPPKPLKRLRFNDKIWPGSASTKISTGRQQTSQSVVKRCEAMLVSMTSSKVWPQNGQLIEAETCTIKRGGLPLRSSQQPYQSKFNFSGKPSLKESI